MEQRREARDVDHRVEPQLDGLAEYVAGAIHVGAEHLRRLAWVGGDQGGAVHDGVAAGERLADRVAVLDVADDVVRHVDAQLGDGGLQLGRSSDQEADRMARVGNGLGGPAADKSRTSGYQNMHDAMLWRADAKAPKPPRFGVLLRLLAIRGDWRRRWLPRPSCR